MIRAALVTVTFPISLYTHVYLFGWERGVIGAAALTLIVSFAAFGLWPEKRSNPVKIEPRLSRPESQGIEIRGETPNETPAFIVPAAFSAEDFREVRGDQPTVLRMVMPDDYRPTIEMIHDGAAEVLRDLAAQVTPELLAKPIPTDARKVLEDLVRAAQ